MIDPKFELERLRQTLLIKGYASDYIESAYAQASREISNAINDSIASALDEATQAGISVDADEFVSELRTIYIGNSFEITTDSGRTDFSEPPFPMMASLLKNPKVAKDGTLYKVIPVGGRNTTSSNAVSSLFDAQQNIALSRQQASAGTQNDPIASGLQFSGSFAAMKSANRNKLVKSKIKEKNSKGVNFRTVTNKQNPSTQWVQPAKDKDMTSTLDSINAKLRVDIEQSVMGIIQDYGG